MNTQKSQKPFVNWDESRLRKALSGFSFSAESRKKLPKVSSEREKYIRELTCEALASAKR